MIDCVIVGDSIAVGTHTLRKECVAYAKGGINTWQWNRMYTSADLTASVAIISLGSNDHKYIKTEVELRKMRSRIKSERVFWILPHGNLKASEVPIENIQSIVRKIALENGDEVIPIKGVSPDKIHPTLNGYKDIVEKTK